MKPILYIQLLNDDLKSLYSSRSNYNDDSGIDLFCPSYVVCELDKTTKIDFQIRCEMKLGDKNIPYLLVPRSSIYKTPLRMSNSVGIIDKNYRGNICANVDCHSFNLNSDVYIVNKGDRIFQIVTPNLEPFDIQLVDSLSTTDRGLNGFGSTGN